MKMTILCALLALVPASLIAAERVAIQARFIETAPRRAVPHDLARLNQTRGIDVLTPPRANTTLGRPTTIEVTREFRLGTLPYGTSRSVPTGVFLTVTPHRHKGQFAYTAALTVRDLVRLDPTGPINVNKHVTEFTSRELFLSGTCKDGEPVWFEFTLPNGSRKLKLVICLEMGSKLAS